jgi:hypothetical protein
MTPALLLMAASQGQYYKTFCGFLIERSCNKLECLSLENICSQVYFFSGEINYKGAPLSWVSSADTRVIFFSVFKRTSLFWSSLKSNQIRI